MSELSYGIEVDGKESCLWRYRSSCSGTDLTVAAPVFEIDGELVPAVLKKGRIPKSSRNLPNDVMEHTYSAPLEKIPDLTLELVFRVAPGNPVLRFRYRLKCEGRRTLTKKAGQDNLSYFSLSLNELPVCKEVRFGEFDDCIHSFRLTENDVPQRLFDYKVPVMGPMLVANDEKKIMLMAYEHGSQTPDAFLEYHLSGERSVSLRARKGNYCNGQTLDPDHSFETIWMQTALISGSEDDLAEAYRTFVLKRLTPNMESRKPYIYYNTWSYQERNKWWNKKKFLDSMNQERMLAEIDVAAEMGVDVFVLDTGWYEKTGDWRVNTKRFDENLKTVKARLDSHWINIASLILGQNGIWGDPLSVSKEGVALFGWQLGLYKQVRDDITAAFPVRTGRVGGCPEIHEKICSSTGKGVVVIFAPFGGSYSCVTKNRVVTECQADAGLVVSQGEDGRARIDATFDKPGAKIVFFGVTE
ncbi:MAG: hypothetical protein E4H02_06765 [Lentisphaerales bacterium]|nr:MAG: hypothetical protein E4H02_06765 [Lentisphaerales bacterium]